MTIDLRALNKITVPDVKRTPSQEDILSSLHGKEIHHGSRCLCVFPSVTSVLKEQIEVRNSQVEEALTEQMIKVFPKEEKGTLRMRAA